MSCQGFERWKPPIFQAPCQMLIWIPCWRPGLESGNSWFDWFVRNPGSAHQLRLVVGVSKNMGKPPKSSILIGFSIVNHLFWGTTIFGNTQLKSHYLPGFFTSFRWWKPDFWAINSMVSWWMFQVANVEFSQKISQEKLGLGAYRHGAGNIIGMFFPNYSKSRQILQGWMDPCINILSFFLTSFQLFKHWPFVFSAACNLTRLSWKNLAPQRYRWRNLRDICGQTILKSFYTIMHAVNVPPSAKFQTEILLLGPKDCSQQKS